MLFKPGPFVIASAILIVSGIAGTLAYRIYSTNLPPKPQRPLRIGFEPNPPFQIRTNSAFGGLAIEILNEAARRARVLLEWVETGTSSEEAFQRGLVDLWPLMTDLPERRKLVHFSEPWVISSHVLLLGAGTASPGGGFTGRIGLFRMPLHARLLRSEFPGAQQIQLSSAVDVLQSVCNGAAAAGFLEKRVAMTALKEMPSACMSKALRVENLPALTLKTCIASTFETAATADLLRREIGRLYRDGTLAVTMAKYSFYGLDDAWATHNLMQTLENTRWMAWGTAAFTVALTLALWQAVSLRQRKRAQAVVRASEERFRSIFQQAGVGVAQVSLDGKVELANDRYCEVVGHAREDLVGKGTREITLREDLKQQIAMMPRLLAGEIQSFSTEKRYKREDGTFVWAEMCKSLVRDVDGRPFCFIAVVQDITERKHAEAALKESEERFRHLADSAPVLIWVSGPDKRCTFVNKTWLEFTGHALEQELGDGWVGAVHPEDRERSFETYSSAFDQRRDFQVEYRLMRADGAYRWILDRGVARFSAGDVFAGYIGSCVDLTDLKESYEQHLATQKLESLGILAAGVAHDFNNLLGAIIARAELAHADIDPRSSAAADLDQIHLTARRAAEIASQMMTFAKQENGPSRLIDLSELVAETLDLLKVSIAKSAVLTTDLAADLPPICGNPAEIRQVVMNLIINASEALEDKPGTIAISTTRAPIRGQSGEVCLQVRDTGSGMTSDVKRRMFDPFFTTRFVGRGLGLAAVQGIIRRHGGSIEVDSKLGEGTRFLIFLPCAAEDGTPKSAGEIREGHAVAPCGTVLLIDDEESLRSVVAKLLRKRGFRVIEAADGETAIEKLKSDPNTISLILLDVTLAGMSVRDVFDALHRIRPELKVILSTAYSREKAMSEIGDRDVWGFIRKPYRSDDLVQLLQKATAAS